MSSRFPFDRFDGWTDISTEIGIRVEEFEKDGQFVIRVQVPRIDPDKDVELAHSASDSPSSHLWPCGGDVAATIATETTRPKVRRFGGSLRDQSGANWSRNDTKAESGTLIRPRVGRSRSYDTNSTPTTTRAATSDDT